jgi:antitoxin component YwqK of YwqJK toxin-antitoxin module
LSNEPVKAMEKILKPVISPLVTKFLKPLRDAQKLPGIFINKLQKVLKTMLNTRESSLQNYVLMGSYYVSKRLLVFVAIVILVIVYLLFIQPPKFVNKWFNRIPVMQENSSKIAAYSGPAKVVGDNKKAARYEGGIVDGKYSGQGKLFGSNGKPTYEGEFDKGNKNGAGTEYNEKGDLLYKGLFAYDVYNGAGTQYYEGKKVQYVGEFQNGKYGGTGKLYAPTGEIIYEGAFGAGRYNGAGKLFSPSGTVLYEGEFAAGEYNGAGKLFNKAGLPVYEGGFKNGLYSGEGTEYYANGFVKYKGQFLVGTYSGEGSAFDEKGLIRYKGTYQNAVANGPGEAYDEAGKLLYKGDFVNGAYEGIGILYDKDGAPILKSFFAGGRISLQSFIGLSSKKIEDLLGKSPEITLQDDSVLIAGQDAPPAAIASPAPDAAGGGTGVAGTGAAPSPAASIAPGPGMKLLMNYPDYQMSVMVQPSQANPKEAVVTSLSIWGSKPLSVLQPAIETIKDRLKPNDDGYRVLELQVRSGAGIYTNSYFKDDFIFTLTHFTNEKPAHLLQVSSTK